MATSIPTPLAITTAGAVPTPPTTLLQTLIANVSAQQPGYTANLPGSLIEDISSTDTGAIAMIDQFRVDAVNVLPITSNPYTTTLLGQQCGIPQGTPTNTSVPVNFAGTPGYVIPAGFLVSDGTYQYQTQDGTIVQASGFSGTVTAVATVGGAWAVPANTVSTIITSVPSPYTLTVTNNSAGTPAQSAETLESYQARVIQAQQAAGIGTIQYLKTLLQAVPGVVPRLVNVLIGAFSGTFSGTLTGWKVIVGGGDVYAVGNAIALGVTDISRLLGSTISSLRNIGVSVIYPPDTYQITYIDPPPQTVTATVIWNTTLPNFTSGAQVNGLAAPALVSYINSIQQGQAINLLDMTAVFQNAVASVLPTTALTTLEFTISINAVQTNPTAGTSIIPGDPESYFSAAANAFTVQQG